jgi:hypothetical protein
MGGSVYWPARFTSAVLTSENKSALSWRWLSRLRRLSGTERCSLGAGHKVTSYNGEEMKIHAEVLAAETIGDGLRLKLQGNADVDAEWRPMLALSIEVPDHARNRRAYYIGRKVAITIDAL